MAEQTMRTRVLKALLPIDAIPVENPVACPGTPDINHLYGWLELKQLAAWPVRPDTVVSVPTFTPQQKIWLRRRWGSGGIAYLLLQVKDEWLLFNGDVAAACLGCLPRAALVLVACRYWPRGLVPAELLIACSTRKI